MNSASSTGRHTGISSHLWTSGPFNIQQNIEPLETDPTGSSYLMENTTDTLKQYNTSIVKSLTFCRVAKTSNNPECWSWMTEFYPFLTQSGSGHPIYHSFYHKRGKSSLTETSSPTNSISLHQLDSIDRPKQDQAPSGLTWQPHVRRIYIEVESEKRLLEVLEALCNT